VRHVAQNDPVEKRVDRLRGLLAGLMNNYIALARGLYEEHVAELWTKAPGHWASEEDFLEESVGIKRRTSFELLAIGAVLAQIAEKEEASKELGAVGMYKLGVLVPVLKSDPTMPTVRRWTELARTHSREALRELVAKALGRKLKDAGAPGERFKTYIIGAMPDGESRELATEFFERGAQVLGNDHPITVLIAAFQECLGTWIVPEKVRDGGGAHV
jgi:hypothetical protein